MLKYILVGLLLFVISCQTSEKKENKQTGEKLSSVDRARIDFAKQSMERIVAEWNQPTKEIDRTCMILFGKQHEWILNCSSPLVGNTIDVSESPKDPVYFTANSLSVPGVQVPYEGVAPSIVAQASVLTPYLKKEKNVDFPPIVLMQKMEDLVVHHPGFSESPPKSEEILSIFTHEFFHVAQFTNPAIVKFMDTHLEKNDFENHPTLEQFYVINQAYQESVKKEYNLLSDYLRNEKQYSQESAKKVLKKWLGLYNQRIKKFSKDFANDRAKKDLRTWDSFWTFIEGSARYVESDFYLNPKIRANSSLLASDPFFGNFSMINGTKYNALPDVNKGLGNRYYYSLGMHLAFVLDIATGEKWKKTVFENPEWIVGEIRKLTAPQ